VQVGSTGAGRADSAEQGVAIVARGADIITQGDVTAVALNTEALIAGRIGTCPRSGRRAQSQLGGARSTCKIAATIGELEACARTSQSPLESRNGRSIASQSGRQAAQVDTGSAHCGVGTILTGGQCIIAVVACVGTISCSNDDVGACSQIGSAGDELIGVGATGAAAVGTGVATVGTTAAGRTADGQKLNIVVVAGSGGCIADSICAKLRGTLVEDDATVGAGRSGNTIGTILTGTNAPVVSAGAGGEVGAGGILQILGTIGNGVVAAVLGNGNCIAFCIVCGNSAIGNGDLSAADLACEGAAHCVVGAADLSGDDILSAGDGAGRSRAAVGRSRGLGVAAVLTSAGSVSAACAGRIGATRASDLMRTIAVAGVLVVMTESCNRRSADDNAAGVAGNSGLTGRGAGCSSGRGASAAVAASGSAGRRTGRSGIGQLVEVQISGTGARGTNGAEQGAAIVARGADVVTQGDVAAVTLNTEALIAGGIGTCPRSSAGAQSQLGGAGSTCEIAATGSKLEAGTGTGHGPLVSRSAGSTASQGSGEAGEGQALSTHCGIGTILAGGQCIVAVVSCIGTVSSSQNDIFACGQTGRTGNKLIGVVAAGRSAAGVRAGIAGIAAGVGAGRGGILLIKSPSRVNSLVGVNVALTGISVLTGDNDRECNIVAACRAIGVGAVSRIPLAVGGLHGGNSGSNSLACDHAIPEGSFVLIVAGEGYGLRIAVNNLSALVVQRLIQAVGSHAQADCHPNNAVRSLGGHVIGNSGAVDTIGGAAAVECVVISTIGAGNSSHIGAGDAGTGIQTEIGTVSLGNVVLATGVVSDAVRVEKNDCAGLDCLSNIGNSSCSITILSEGAAGSRSDALALVLVLVGEAGVSRIRVVVIRGDQVNILATRSATLGSIRSGGDVLALHNTSVNAALTIAELRRVATNDTFGGFPSEELTITVDGAFNVGIGLLDQLFDLVRNLCKVLSGNLAATLCNNILIFVRINDGPNVFIDDGSCLRGDLKSLLILRSDNAGRKQAEHHSYKQQYRD